MATQPQILGTTTPVFAPDGTIAQVPNQSLPDAMAHGGKLAVQIKTPDGALHYIPHDQVGAAQKAGGVINTEQGTPDNPQPKEGFWHSLGSVFGLTSEQLSQKPSMGSAFEAGIPGAGAIHNAVNSAPSLARKAGEESNASFESLKHGDITSFLAHQIGGMGYTGAVVLSPFMGESPAKAGEQFGEGNIKGGLGTTTGILAPAVLDAGVTGVSKVPVGKVVKTVRVIGDPIPGVGQTLDRLARFKDAPAKLREIWAKKAEAETGTTEGTAAGPVPSEAPEIIPPSRRLGKGPTITPYIDASGSVPYTPPPVAATTRAQRLGLLLPEKAGGRIPLGPVEMVAPHNSPIEVPPVKSNPAPQGIGTSTLPRINSGEGVLNQALTSLDNATLLKVARSRGINVTKEAQLKPGAANNSIIKKIIDDFSPDELDEVRNQGIEISRNKPVSVDAEEVTPDAAAEAWRSKVLNTFFPDIKIPKTMQARVENTLQEQLKARFEAARAKAEGEASAVPVDDLQGGHAGNGVTSVEELNRPGVNYVVSRSGQLTYQGKAFAPESTPNGASHVTVLPDGAIRVNAGPKLNASQEGSLRFALKKQPWLTRAAKAGN